MPAVADHRGKGVLVQPQASLAVLGQVHEESYVFRCKSGVQHCLAVDALPGVEDVPGQAGTQATYTHTAQHASCSSTAHQSCVRLLQSCVFQATISIARHSLAYGLSDNKLGVGGSSFCWLGYGAALCLVTSKAMCQTNVLTFLVGYQAEHGLEGFVLCFATYILVS